MRTLKLLFLSTLLASPVALAKGGPKAPAPAKKPDPKAKPAPPKKVVPVSPEHKKAMAELLDGFKFGMSHDEVIKTLSKKVEERYADQLKGTTDVAEQDRIRSNRKKEIDLFAKSFTKFEGKNTGYDVSMIDDEFAHNTGESMLDYWPSNRPRTFYFFADDKLWKMFVLYDLSAFPEEQRNFATLKARLEDDKKFGPGDTDAGKVTWRTDEFNVRTVDKLKMYSMFAVVIEDPKTLKDLMATREQKAPKKAAGSSIVNAVIDKDGTDHPDVKQNNDAVNSVINAQGGGTPKK